MDHTKPQEGKGGRSRDECAALRATEKDRTDGSYIYFSETRGLLRRSHGPVSMDGATRDRTRRDRS